MCGRMSSLDPRAVETLGLRPGEEVVAHWEGQQHKMRMHDELVLTTIRVVFLFANNPFLKSWKVIFSLPLETIDEPTVTSKRSWANLGRDSVEVAGHLVHVGKDAQAARDEIARFRAARLGQKASAGPGPRPQAPYCSRCGRPTSWVSQYGRWYCRPCGQYV
jgi:hypothetical protein